MSAEGLLIYKAPPFFAMLLLNVLVTMVLQVQVSQYIAPPLTAALYENTAEVIEIVLVLEVVK